MEPVNIHQAKTQLSQLLQVVEQGEDVVIARAGVPIARLVGWKPDSQPVAAPGAMRGQIQISADFDAPLDACSRRSSDAAAARHPSSAVVAE